MKNQHKKIEILIEGLIKIEFDIIQENEGYMSRRAVG